MLPVLVRTFDVVREPAKPERQRTRPLQPSAL